MKYINYAKEMKRVVFPRYQEIKPEKSTGFVRSLGDSQIKVTLKEGKKKEEVNESEQMGL